MFSWIQFYFHINFHFPFYFHFDYFPFTFFPITIFLLTSNSSSKPPGVGFYFSFYRAAERCDDESGKPSSATHTGARERLMQCVLKSVILGPFGKPLLTLVETLPKMNHGDGQFVQSVSFLGFLKSSPPRIINVPIKVLRVSRILFRVKGSSHKILLKLFALKGSEVQWALLVMFPKNVLD